MKSFRLLLFFLLVVQFTAYGQTAQQAGSGSTSKIEAFYFHFTSRCTTCKTVESETKKDLETLYPELVKQGNLTFKAVNMDDEPGRLLAEKLQVSGQTLLLVKGSRKINITNEGFLYAVSNPSKLRSIIRGKVDGLLKE